MHSMHSMNSMHSPYASVQASAKINEALDLARANDQMMTAARVNTSPSPQGAAGASSAADKQSRDAPSPDAPTLAPVAVLRKFAAMNRQAPTGVGGHSCSQPDSFADSARRSTSPGSSFAASNHLGNIHHQKAAASGSPPGSWQQKQTRSPSTHTMLDMGSAVASVAFTKWMHMQHRYDTCKDSMSNGLASEDAPTAGALGKRARSQEETAKESSSNAGSPESASDEASASHVSKVAKISEPGPSPLHSVSKASLEDIMATGSTM